MAGRAVRNWPGLRQRAHLGLGAVFGCLFFVACSVDYMANDAEYRCKQDPAACAAGAGGTGVGGTGGTGVGGTGGTGVGGTGGGDGGVAGDASTGSTGGTGGSGGDTDGGGTGGTGGGPCPGGAGPAKVLVHAPSGGPAICIDATEVTYAQYKKFVDANVPIAGQIAECDWNLFFNPVEPKTDGTCSVAIFDSTGSENYPVRCVDWCDAVAYCTWAGSRLCGGIGGAKLASAAFADATKSEWFAACVGGNAPTVYPYGDTYGGQTCNGAENAVNTAIVVKGTPGCHGSGENQSVSDLSGNVSEWEDACDGGTHQFAYCHLRGGSYQSGASALRCDAEQVMQRGLMKADVGFRCCANPL